MKIFIKETRKSITSSHQMLAPRRMANLLASEKCAMLTSDSCKGALYLNEMCAHHGRTRGEVRGSMRLLIKAEHQSPVFRMHLEKQCCQLTQALCIHDYKNVSSCAVNRLTRTPELLLLVMQRQPALAREEVCPGFSGHCTLPSLAPTP